MVSAAPNRRSKSRGFTLLEVMITVAIVGVLTSIALPMYYEQVIRSKLIDGTGKLGEFKGKMDRYWQDNRTYLNGAACGIPNPVVTGSDYFQITCGAPGPLPTATSYTIWASGIAAKGTANFRFTIDNTDAKTSSGPAGWLGSGTCWAIRKDGSCF